tara:strand:- start:1122 stop:3383 length:2262 start_codon:yes stop_codon:yes gene_type:complete
MAVKNYSFPRQAISDSEKDLEWCKQNLKAITKYVGATSSGQENSMSSRDKDINNYNLYNGFINAKDYEYITDQYGIPYPAQMANFPLISTKIDLLVNEDADRPLDKKVKSINKKAAIRKQNFKVSLVANELLKEVKDEFEQKFGVKAQTENDNFPIPDDIDEFMRYEYKELIEEVCQDGLDYLIEKYRMKDMFRDGLRDFLVTGKVFYKVYVKNGDPYVRRIDPRTLIWDKTVQTDYLEDAQWVAEERWLTINETIDEFREDLKQEDIQKLEELKEISSHEGLSNWNSEFEWVDYSQNKGVRIRIVTCEWKSIKQLKFKVSENKHDKNNPFKKIVTDNYKPRKNEKIENLYVDDIWEATEIGGQVYVQCRRRPNQVRSVDDAGSTPLSFVGCVHNHTTGSSKSLTDLLRHTQMLYNIVHYHIELTLARAGGKAVIYDVAQLPTNIGMDMQTVMYHLKTDGVIPINSMQEGQEATKFNQFQQVDFTLSSSVQQLINLKLMLEQTAGQISGVSPQREGAISQYEYVGNVQRSVVQSSLSTKGWFFQHNEVKKMVFERVCNLMKVCWSNGKKAGYVLGDGGYKFLNVLPDIALNDYGIFLGDSGKDDAMRKMVQEMSSSAVQSGNLTLLDAIKVLKSESLSEAEAVLERGLESMKDMQKQMQEQQAQQQEMMQQQQMQIKQEEMKEKQSELDNRIKIAQIAADSRIEVAEIQSEQKVNSDTMKEKNKLIVETSKADLQDQLNENQARRVSQSNLNK